MGYMHIDNLYKDTGILFCRECYALEKVHGTSAHVAWKDEAVRFFSGGAKQGTFVAIFDIALVEEAFCELGHEAVTVYGEAYGGKMQGMRKTYGDELRFIAFDVRIGDTWLAVPDAEEVAVLLGFEFVPYERVSTDIEVLDACRDKPSEIAVRRGYGDRPREGVVLRPLIELTRSNGDRLMAKHKGDAFRETNTPRKVAGPAKQVVLVEAAAIAKEWVTEMRLSHVLDALGGDVAVERMREILSAMVEDVEREAAGEIEMTKAARTAICRRTATMVKSRLQARLHENQKEK